MVSAIGRYPVWGVRCREVSSMGCLLLGGIQYALSATDRYPVLDVPYRQVSSTGCPL